MALFCWQTVLQCLEDLLLAIQGISVVFSLGSWDMLRQLKHIEGSFI